MSAEPENPTLTVSRDDLDFFDYTAKRIAAAAHVLDDIQGGQTYERISDEVARTVIREGLIHVIAEEAKCLARELRSKMTKPARRPRGAAGRGER
jgi:hypothetical protein